MKETRFYDNGGKTTDRYTAVFMDMPEWQPGTFYALAMNAYPFDPQGIGMSTTAMPGRHLGRRVALDSLPADCRRLVAQIREA